ncbi:AGC protein kinase [Saprolegnia parasitica CBS 223.65]|uniref:AGC protein kinase n=1 Tax=Saprolegnia parasitica (strain CBS 223.65) TaxID=695850 RepID=A0A067C5J5_SAPPC|nr:AGC protein kinase [Saprolegnia parasitica CBS 223.65]KDO24420.1 AGC protein kinase [Saprolegnia parasitica CBS 223.65]|eukprot:XP_012204850.1 AGC protein kinase [Saprolegnia parasitica CBS 223.65]
MVRFNAIVGHEIVSSGGSKHTVYILEVQIDNMSYVVKHRYHEFKELHDTLVKEGYKCTAVPPKKFIGSLNPEFVHKRQLELSVWLQQLCAWDPTSPYPNPHNSEALKVFLLEHKEPRTTPPSDTSANCVPKPQAAPKVEYVSKASSELDDSAEFDKEANMEDEITLYNTPKTRLDDFELLKVIGKGSYGKVTLVRKKDSKKLYAMKTLSKPNVKRRNQVEHTRTERRVLGLTKHPYIVHLHYAFQTTQKLYFVIDYCPGGELFFHLSRMERFSESMACFYAAEIVLALDHLHQLGVVYRDLKPENILFDATGHVLLADFGLAKEGITDGAEGTNSMCGTPEYLPPEILDRVGHGTSVDWWALGMVLYEMLTGLPPWYTRNRQKLFDRVRNAPLTFPDYVSAPAQSLIAGLLNRNPTERLGNKSAKDIQVHPFFATINWDALYARELPPPFNPCANINLEETKNFEAEFTKMQLNSVPDATVMGGSYNRSSDVRGSITFQGFTYNTPSDMNNMGIESTRGSTLTQF